MRSILAIIITLSLFSLTLHAAELSPGAERAIASYERQVARAAEEFRDEVADAREELADDLEREIDRATRRGQLDLALAIRQHMRDLTEREEVPGPETEDMPGETDLLGRPVTPKRGEPQSVKDLDVLTKDRRAVVDQAVARGVAIEINKDGLGRELLMSVPALPGFRSRSLVTGLHELPEPVGKAAKAVGLVSRDYGGFGEDADYIQDVTITINGQPYELDRWSANRVLILPVPGGQIREFTMRLGTKSWDPRLESILLFE